MARLPLPHWLPPLAACACAGLLALLSLLQLASAERLDAELKNARAVHVIHTRLLPLLQAGDDSALRTQTAALIDEAALGLTYLAVSVADGRALAADGRYEALLRSGLPLSLTQPLRRALYRWTGTLRQLSVQAAAGQAPVQIDYVVAPQFAAAIHDSAISRLRWFGFFALLLSAAGIGAGVLVWRRSSPASSAWLQQRIDPEHRPAERAFSASEVEARVTETLYQRAGGLLDDVRRGVLITDRDGRVRYLNQTAAQLTGWTLADAQGQLVYSVFRALDERSGQELTPAETSMRDDRSYLPTEMRLRSRDGTQRPIEVMATPLRPIGGPLEGAAMLFHDIGEREAKAEQWRRQARLSMSVIDHLFDGVLTANPAGVIRFANARAARMFGYARQDLEGVNVSKLMPVPFVSAPGVRLTDYIGVERGGGLPKVVGWRRDATTFPVELVVQTMTIEQSEGLLVIVRDITERLRSENLAQRLGRLLDAAAEEIYIFDAQTLAFVEVNRGARRNLGYHPSEMTRMTPLTISEELDLDSFHGYLARLREGQTDTVAYRCQHRRADGSRYPVEVRLNFSREEEPPVFMAIAIDITEREEAEQKLRYLAHNDALTGLPNRATLQDRLRQAILSAHRSNRQLGVLFMDVDKFKHYNDTYGHEVGDLVLKEVARRLSGVLRASDTVARLGGDEFVVVAAGLHSVDDAVVLARKIEAAIAPPLPIPGHDPLLMSVSIGIALYPLDESDSDGLLHHADIAMYQAKQAGRGQHRVYSIDVPPAKRRKLDLERGIQVAVALNQFRLELTPVFDVAGGRVVRAALADLYWQHPRHGRVDSAEVFAAASRAGLLADLELWSLYTATAPATPSRQPPISLIVRLSGYQLRDPDFVGHIEDLIERNLLPPGQLIVATDAEGLRQAARQVPAALQQLSAQGLRFALRGKAAGLIEAVEQGELPAFALLILDEADGLAAADERALQSLVSLAQANGLPLLVLGVDDDEAGRRLQQHGIELQAGSALSPARGPDEFAAWLNSQTRDLL